LSGLGESEGEFVTASEGNGSRLREKPGFKKGCTGGHALETDRKNSRLAGVYDRKAGSVPVFSYSPGSKKLGVTWTDETLEKWLSDLDLMVPDNVRQQLFLYGRHF